MKKTLRMIFLLSAMFCMTSVAMADDEVAEEDKVKLRNEISGYAGTITRLKREREEKLAKLSGESNVSISREEVSACYIVIR